MIRKFGPAATLATLLLWHSVTAADELSSAYAKGLEQFRAQNYEAALPHFRETLRLAEERFGPADPKVAVELNNLAEVYRLMGDYEAAEPLYVRALELDEQNLDPGNPDLATSLNNLALLYRAQDRLSEAEALYERSLDILQKALGPRHPNVAKSLNNLAVLYDAQGRHAEAATLIERAVSISSETLGPAHPTTATLTQNLETMTSEVDGETVIAATTAPLSGAEADSSATKGEEATTQSVVASEASPSEKGDDRIEPAAGGGDYVVHLASVRSVEEAAAEWRRLTGAYGLPESLPQAEPLKVTTNSGVFYRVWGGGFPDEGTAAKVCDPITANGNYCKVMKLN